MGPIDYSSQVQNPFQSVLAGYQGGAAIRNDVQQQEQYRAAQQAAMAQRQQQAEVLNSLISNKNATASDYANASLLVPGLKDQLKQSWEMKSSDQQQSQLRDVSQVYAAVSNGRPDLAAQKLNERAAALEAAGGTKQEVQALKSQAEAITAHPEFARATVGMMLASLPGGEKLIASATTMGKEQREAGMYPTELRKGRAEAALTEGKAGITAVEAANAPVRVGLENANIESTIQDRAAGQEIARGQLGVAQENAMTGRGNLVLDQQKQTAAMGEKKKTESLAAQDQIDTINSSLSSVQALAKHPSIDLMVGSYTGKLNSNIPGSSRKDIEALVDTVKSQQFLTGIKQMSGMGALSNAEGDKIGSAVASLSLDQSPKAFKNALGVIQSTLEKAQAKAVASGKLPETGGAFVMKLPRIGNVTESDINKLLAKNPGSTREQAIKYLESLQTKPGGATGGF